jgi:hypothetical protein
MPAEASRPVMLLRSSKGILAMGLLSFLFGCGETKNPFEQKDGAWYYLESLIEGADAKTFQVLNENYAKDKDRVYYGDTYRKGQEYYAIKHSRVKVLDRADPATFRYLNYDYARDKSSVFYEGVAFAIKDIGTFELIDRAYARDRVTGYYHQRPIPGSDGASFVVLGSSYSRDARQVFYSTLVPRGTDPIRRSTPIKGALPESFKVLDSDGYAADASQAYYQGEVLTKDAATFKRLELGYAKTGTVVYFEGKPVAGADAASFEMMLERIAEGVDARDRNATYRRGERTQPK